MAKINVSESTYHSGQCKVNIMEFSSLSSMSIGEGMGSYREGYLPCDVAEELKEEIEQRYDLDDFTVSEEEQQQLYDEMEEYTRQRYGKRLSRPADWNDML